MENVNLQTQFFRAALKLLGTNHGIRVTIGVVLGLILDGVRSAIVAAIGTNQSLGVALEGFGPVPTFGLGILIAFVPLLWQKRIVSENIKQTFDAMDETIERAELGRAWQRKAYITVLDKIVKHFPPSESPPIKDFVEDTTQEVIAEGKEK